MNQGIDHSRFTKKFQGLDCRLTSEKDGKNQTITYRYDPLGRMTSYTDAKGATFSFQYDKLERLTRRTEADGTYQTYTHDIAGRLTGIANNTLDTTAYTLSPDGRRTAIQRSGDTLVPVMETYGYDNARQATNAAYTDLSTTQAWKLRPRRKPPHRHNKRQHRHLHIERRQRIHHMERRFPTAVLRPQRQLAN